MILYVVRHGETDWNRAHKVQGHTDIPLNNYGRHLARETAEALFDGNMDKVFENQQKANSAYEKKLRAEMVKQDPKPDGAGGDDQKKDAAVEFARNLGKQRADALKSANEGLKHYF